MALTLCFKLTVLYIFVGIIVYLIVFDVYPCWLWILCISANIQFMETGNLLSPDKGDMSDFLWTTLYLSGAWALAPWAVVANGLVAAWPYAHLWSAGRRCGWPNFGRQYSSAGWAARRQRYLWPNSFPGSGISPPTCTCGLRRRSRVILATGVNRPAVGYLSRPQRREIFRFEWERFERGRFWLVVDANVACFVLRTV